MSPALRWPSAWASWWAPRPAQPPAQADELVITKDQQVRRLLVGLVQAGRCLQVQAGDAAIAGRASLRLGTAGDLELCLPPMAVDELVAGGELVNVAASGSSGLLLFTLGRLQRLAAGRLGCAWPQQVIQVQSRRHYRVSGLSGPRHEATLTLPGLGTALPLHDLSEEGVGIFLGGRQIPVARTCADAVLTLDGTAIVVPSLQLVHKGASTTGPVDVAGAQLMGLAAPDVQHLRRWIASAQAASAGRAVVALQG